MKRLRIVLLFAFLLLFLHCTSEQPEKTLIDNLGIKAPGLIPEPFAPINFHFASHRLHSFPTFSPNGKAVYWSVVPQKVLYSEFVNNAWTPAAIAPFSNGNIQAPFFAPGGEKLYFQYSSNRGMRELDIWFIEKKNGTWGEKHQLPSPPNSEKMETQPSLTKDGTLYFGGFYEQTTWNRGIYRSRQVDSVYQEPELLPKIINSPYADYTPFIAPDESFLLFSSTRPTDDEKDIRLYVSFHDSSDTWSVPVNINEKMNFDKPSRFPSLTPDGQFIVFLSGGEYYWVSSKILDQCRKVSDESEQ